MEVHRLPQQDLVDVPPDGGPWQRFEFYWKLSTPGLSDGAVRSWLDHKNGYVLTGAVTRPLSVATQKIDNFILPAMNDEQGGEVLFEYYVDDVYVDTTFSRVEVCDTPTWIGRRHCEIQPVTVWTTTSVTFTGEVGTFPIGSDLYLYIIDGNGDPNPTGYPLMGQQAPRLLAPQRLRVES